MNDLKKFEALLMERSNGACELCGSGELLSVLGVPPGEASGDRSVLVCGTCSAQIDGNIPVDGKHWFCLRDAMWSEVAAVQVMAYRMLKRQGAASWAQDLLDQMYLPDDVQAWADAGLGNASGEDVQTLDSNGTQLADGDSVTLIKDLKVKGGGFTAKRGTLVKNIRLIGDPDNIEGYINKMMLVLKTQFLKKA